MVKEGKGLQEAFSTVTTSEGLLRGMDAVLRPMTGTRREGHPVLRDPALLPLSGHLVLDIIAFQSVFPTLPAQESFLRTVLLLKVVKVHSDPEASATCPTNVWFLPITCSLMFSKEQNVSQDWTTHVTGTGLLDRRTCHRSPKPE